MLRRFLALAFVGLTAIFVAPAHATLLVRADGNGLLVRDQNGISDNAFINSANSGLQYLIVNDNPGDVFKFDRQAGCASNDDNSVLCDRNGPNFTIELLAGNDTFAMFQAPIGNSSVIAGAGNDKVNGHAGTDVITGGLGDDRLTGEGGSDEIEGASGTDRLEGGAGDDTLRVETVRTS